MEPVQQNPIPEINPVSVPENPQIKNSGWKSGFFVLLFLTVLIIAGGVYYLFVVKPTGNQPVTEIQPSASPAGTSTTLDEWVTVPKNFTGLFTFQYPAGWHIASQWPVTGSMEGISYYLDPNPLNFAPRGGPISALRIVDTAGKDDVDELFAKDINIYKASLTDLQEETLDSSIGPIYHYSGKMDIYGELKDAEGYFFQIQGSMNNLVNKSNIFVTADTNKGYSEILKKLVLSFKKV